MNNHFKKTLLAVIFTLVATGFTLTPAIAQDSSGKVFELRIYTATTGNLENLHARFRDHTNRLFAKHNLKVVGYWTPTNEEQSANTLIYILEHPSSEDAGKNWRAFGTDPEWTKVAADSNANGQILANIESTYMSATDFSPLK